MSRRPDFIRESMWRLLDDSERAAIHDVVASSREASARLAKAQEDVSTHRRLARKFADQARSLLESMRDRDDSHGSPPSVVRRVATLAEDLDTAAQAELRKATPESTSESPDHHAAVAYTPPTEMPVQAKAVPVEPKAVPVEPDVVRSEPEEMDDELRVKTQVGASRRTRSQVTREPIVPDPVVSEADPSVISYEGDLEMIEDVEDI